MTRRVSPAAWAAWAVFVLAFALRAAWVAWVDNPFDNVFSDMQGYIDRAHDAAYGTNQAPRIFDTFYSPGAHLIYAAQMRLVGWNHHVPYALLHCLWGAVVAPCAMLLALRIVRRLPVAVLFGVAVATWDPLLAFTGYFSSEQPDAALLALSTWLCVRVVEGKRGALALGATVGLAYLVRSQVILTVGILGLVWLAGKALRRPWARPRFVPLCLTAVVVTGAVVFGAWRYHALSGRWGLICDDEGMARIFADTSYGKVRAIVPLPDGRILGEFFFAPPSKVQTGENAEYSFTGYLGDPELLAKGRREAVAKMTFGQRLQRWGNNVSLLFVRNELWPENTDLPGRPLRIAQVEVSKGILLGVLLPLAAIGIGAGLWRPRPVLVVCIAHVFTSLFTAAFFYGENRYRVPYDTFFFLLALAGLVFLAPRLARWLAAPVAVEVAAQRSAPA
jgi:hypothetical protein